MATPLAKRKEAVRQFNNSQLQPSPPTLRAFSHTIGVPEQSLRRWCREFQDEDIEPPVALTLASDVEMSTLERQGVLAEDCLLEAQRLVRSLASEETAKAVLDTANAAGKLIEKYQALTGQATDRTEVTHLGDFTNETLDKLLEDMGYIGPPVEELRGPADDEVQPGTENLG